MSKNAFNEEYYSLLDSVRDYDKTLLTIKGWGVTVSLAALGFGFQNQHYGLFFVAAIGAFSFWVLEGIMKQSQLRFFTRMREIEVINYEARLQGVEHGSRYYSTPQIDWSKHLAPDYYTVKTKNEPPPKPQRITKDEGVNRVWRIKFPWPYYSFPWLAPRIALPHVIIFLAGSILLVLGLSKLLPMPV